MTIFSPSDDFWCRSLANFPGPVSRLEYISGLRQEGGVYLHWGLSRTHGEAAANHAIAGAHSKVFSEILQTPLIRLRAEIQSLAAEHGISAREVIASLLARRDSLIPPKLNGGSRLHFNSIWKALSDLERVQEAGSGQAA